MPDWNAIRLYSQFRQDLGPKRYGAFRTTGVDLSHWVSFGFSGVTAADRFEAPGTKEIHMKVKSLAGALLVSGLLVPGSLFIEGCAKKVAAVKPAQTSPPVAIAAASSTPAKSEPARRPAPVAQVASVRT